MDLILLVVGFLLIILAVSDLLVNTLVLNGAGKVTKHISSYVWKLLWHLARKNGKSRILSYSSIMIILAIFLYYLLCIWAGLWLIYAAEPDSIISASTRKPASWLEKLYFIGYVISTMGLGDFQPFQDFYKITTSVFSLLGLSVMTLFITYIIPVASAGVQKQVLGNYIYGLGDSPPDIITKGYDAESKSIYKVQFQELYQMLIHHTESHLAYPILHYYHNTYPQYSFIVNLVNLDEVLHVIKYSVSKDAIDQKNIDLLIFAINNYRAVVKSQSHLFQSSEDPPPPIERLRNHEIAFELKDPDKEVMEKWNDRRMDWQRMLYFEGWDFGHVYPEKKQSKG